MVETCPRRSGQGRNIWSLLAQDVDEEVEVEMDYEGPGPERQCEGDTGSQGRDRPAFDWVTIPAGRFWMGKDLEGEYLDDERQQPMHCLYLPTYRISRVPVTNAQYGAFVHATGHRAPGGWQDGGFPEGKEHHPVVYVDWHDAMAFCRWAGVRLPTEAEWEKAARGADRRLYPWGNTPPTLNRCNYGWKVDDTTEVGAFPEGASPYGVLDMAGNIDEWTNTLYRPYPYDPLDGREDPTSEGNRVYRGGTFLGDAGHMRCTARNWADPILRVMVLGFRVVACL
jgi:serine/threonine-protein kinase